MIQCSGPPLSSRYPAILVAAILSALLAPIWVRNFSAFISSRRLSFSKAAAFGMLSDRPMHKGAVARHLIVFDRLARCNQTGIDRGATAEILDRVLALRDNTVDRFARLGLGPFAQYFEHLFKTLDMALCLFAVCYNRLRKLGISAALAILGRVPKKLLFRAVNILQLRQNRSLSVFSTMGISF
jgi:hypothetical protein